MKQKKFFASVLAATLAIGLVLAGCEDAASGDVRVALSAGSPANVVAAEVATTVAFTGGFSWLSLTAADFEVSAGGSVAEVTPTNGSIAVTVAFPVNKSATGKTYTVSVAPSSTKIKGSAPVTVTQNAASADARASFTAERGAVKALAAATTTDVAFTATDGDWIAGLTAADFTVTGGTFTSVRVSNKTVNTTTTTTATVTVGFQANTTGAPKTIEVAVNGSGSPTIKGNATVAITQAAVGGLVPVSLTATAVNKLTLTFSAPVAAIYDKSAATVGFTAEPTTGFALDTCIPGDAPNEVVIYASNAAQATKIIYAPPPTPLLKGAEGSVVAAFEIPLTK
jgi:hypothetical protein